MTQEYQHNGVKAILTLCFFNFSTLWLKQKKKNLLH